MNMIEIYKEILKTGLMSVDEENMVVQPNSVEDPNDTVPTMISGKRLVLPTAEHLRHPDPDQKLIFHPFRENVLQGESAVIDKLKNMYSVVINMAIMQLIKGLYEIGLSHNDHGKLNPKQSAVLSILKNVDDKSLKDTLSVIFAGAKKEEISNLFFKIFLKRGGTIKDTKYDKVGVVKFPLYQELIDNPEKPYGISLRKKDQGTLAKLLEYIFPKIKEAQAYDAGSDDDHAPYLEALLLGVANVGEAINKTTHRFQTVLLEPDKCKVSLGWRNHLNTDNYLSEIRQVPPMPGNLGNRKVQEIMQEQANLSQAINEKIKQEPEIAERPANTVSQTTPPWEPQTTAPIAAPAPVAAAIPAPVPPIVQNYPSAAPAATNNNSRVMSVTELLGSSAPYGYQGQMGMGYGGYQAPVPMMNANGMFL